MKDRHEIEVNVERQLAATMPAVDLLEVTTSGAGEAAMLRVVIDHPDGVTHDLCADVTRRLEEIGLRDQHGIEVWSPGPERPLRTERHFRDAVGRRIALWRVGGSKRPQHGRLVAVDGERLRLDIAGEVVVVARDQVRRAHIAPEGDE